MRTFASISALALCAGLTAPAYAETAVSGVSVVAPPPAGYDPETASPAFNARFHLPPEPDAAAAPRIHDAWQHAVHAAPSSEPVTLHHTGIFHAPAKSAPHPRTAQANGVAAITQPNWSGTSVVGGTTAPLEAITLLFTVPEAHPPFGQCNGWEDAAFWPGIDGNGGSGAASVIQAGVDVTLLCNAGKIVQTQYYPWLEWYPLAEVSVTSPAISPGDLVFVEVWTTSATQAYVSFYNYSTDIAATYALTAPAGTTAHGSSVEWILERPSIGNAITNLTNYIAAPFAGGVAWNYAAANPTTYSLGGTPNTGTLQLITMLDNAGKPISVPTIENNSFLWFQTTGSACGVNQNPC
jgi:hypothetical protein